MDARTRTAFALIVVAQAVHSLEEYWFRLYDLFAPARAVADAIGLDRPVGFAVGNIALLLFGIWCYFARVRNEHPSAKLFAWGWALVETADGFGHILLAAAARGYFPGLATAPLLIGSGGYLALRLAKEPS